MEGARKDWRERDGFTLVELIVVIAILGILSGIAYVGYGGYIRYAERAGDHDLIATVNLAFASACEEQGVDRTGLGAGDADVQFLDSESASGTIEVKEVRGLAPEGALETFKASFDDFFDGNRETRLKHYKDSDIYFLNGTDLFSIDREEYIKSAFRGSSFGGITEELFDKMDKTAGVLAGAFDSKNEGKKKVFYTALGFSSEEDLIEELKSKNLLPDDFDPGASGRGTQLANALIFYAAQKVSSTDTSELMDYFSGAPGSIKDNLTDLALSVGIATAYRNSGKCSEGFKALYDDTMKLQGSITSNAAKLQKLKNAMMFDKNGDSMGKNYFTEYKDTMLQKDLNGFLAALEMLGQNSGSADMGSKDAFNGLEDLFNKFMGL